jgi:hypothetical protein
MAVVSIFSDLQATAVITTPAGDVSLPSIVVPASFLPAGTLKRVEVVIKWRKSENTNGLANYLSGSQSVQVQKGAGSLVNAINFVDGELKFIGNYADNPGDVVVGGVDVKTTVNSDNATYNFQWTSALALLATLVLHDVQMGLIFYVG